MMVVSDDMAADTRFKSAAIYPIPELTVLRVVGASNALMEVERSTGGRRRARPVGTHLAVLVDVTDLRRLACPDLGGRPGGGSW